MNTITIPVEVPADLEVIRKPDGFSDGWTQILHGTESVLYCEERNYKFHRSVWQQIAAAIEARKPRPPKFGVGDVVEWSDPHNGPMAGFIDKWWATDGLYEYRLHGYRPYFCEADLTLVRRAAK